MNKLKITLKEDGSISQFAPDFRIMRGSYRNILINLEVPRQLLVDSVKDENGEYQTGNNVRISAIIHTVIGKNIPTKKYELKWVKDYTLNGVEYSLYQRQMPKVFTMWETDNDMETGAGGTLDMSINVINWAVRDNGIKIETNTSSTLIPLPIYPGAFNVESEDIESPSDFDSLFSQVQNLNKDYTEFEANYQEWINQWYLKQKAEFNEKYEAQKKFYEEEFQKQSEHFDGEFKKLNGRLDTVEKDSMIRLKGQDVTDAELMEMVLDLPNGFYVVNTAQFGDETIMISKDGEFIARYTATGASYTLDKEIMDWVMSAGGGGSGGGGSGSNIRLTAMSGLQVTTAVGA